MNLIVTIFISVALGVSLLIGASVLFYKWGWKALSILAFIFFAIMIGLLLGFFDLRNEQLTFLVSPVIVGAVSGISIRYGKPLEFNILISTLLLAVIFTANYYYLKEVRNIDIVLESKAQVVKIIDESERSEEEKSVIINRINESLDIIRDIIPFSYFLNSLLVVAVSLFFIRVIFTRYFYDAFSKIKGIEFFKLNDYVIFVLIAGWLVVLLIDKSKYHLVYTVGLNTALCCSVVYFLQALGIIKYFLMKKNIPQYLLPVFLLVIFFLGMEAILFMSVILVSIGAVDFWADFRKLDSTENNKGSLK